MDELSKMDSGRILDFVTVGMWWQITQTAQDTQGTCFEVLHVLTPRFGELPIHFHPQAEKSYRVLEGILEMCIDGQWRLVKPGETATVPMGIPHTIRNSQAEAVRLISIYKPALGFERFFRRMHMMLASEKVGFPPKNVRSVLRSRCWWWNTKKKSGRPALPTVFYGFWRLPAVCWGTPYRTDAGFPPTFWLL